MNQLSWNIRYKHMNSNSMFWMILFHVNSDFFRIRIQVAKQMWIQWIRIRTFPKCLLFFTWNQMWHQITLVSREEIVRQVQPAFFPSLPNQILPRHFEKLNSNEEKQIPKKIIQKLKMFIMIIKIFHFKTTCMK